MVAQGQPTPLPSSVEEKRLVERLERCEQLFRSIRGVATDEEVLADAGHRETAAFKRIEELADKALADLAGEA